MNEQVSDKSGPGRGLWGPRASVSLACSDCQARNYKTTKAGDRILELKKFCKYCKKHTLHREAR